MIAIITTILIGILSGALTKFFLYLIGSPYQEKVNTGAIFSFYGVWVRQNHDRLKEQIEKRLANVHCTQDSFDRSAARMINKYKALGACPWCINVYIAAISGGFFLWFHDISLWHLVYLLPISHLSLTYIIDNFD